MYLSRKKIITIAAVLFILLLFVERKLVLNFLPNETRQYIGQRVDSLIVAVKKIRDWPYVFYRFQKHKIPVYNIIIDPVKVAELDEYYLKEKDNYNRQTIYKKAVFIGDDGQKYDAKVTYRGDQEVHLIFPKKSWRVVFEDQNLFRNTKALNLIIPEDRLFLVEELNNYRAKKMGLPVPESRFVFLEVNGRNIGIYWEVEQWGKEMLEKNQLSPDTNLYGERGFGSEFLYQDITAWTKYVENPLLPAEDHSDLKRLLDVLNNNSDQYFYDNIGNILDLGNFYRWQAHSALAGGLSQDSFHNARLYFDNTLGKFKFIPWDVNMSRLDDRFKTAGLNHNPVSRRVITSPRMLFESNRALWDYLKDENNLKDDLKFYDKAYRRVRNEFYRDTLKNFTNSFFAGEAANYREMIAFNFNALRQTLSANDIALLAEINPAASRNILTATPLTLVISLNQKSVSPTDILGLKIKNLTPGNAAINAYYDANQNRILDFGDQYLGNLQYSAEVKEYHASNWEVRVWSQLGEREYRDGTKARDIVPSEAMIFVTAAIPLDVGKNLAINVQLRNAVTGEVFEKEIRDLSSGREFAQFAAANQSLDQFVASNPIFSKSSPATLTLGPGSFTLTQTTIIPKNLELKIAAGTTLYLAKGVSLLSYSPVSAIGTAESKIKFLPLDPKAPWGTMAVIGAPGKNNFTHSIFQHQSTPPPPANPSQHALSTEPINGIVLRGMLSVFHSDLRLEKSEIMFSTSDDGVNTKYGRVEIKENNFHDNSADALDVDFVSGLVAGNVFRFNGNDAIDISGADLTIRDNVILRPRDKGVSIGEKSKTALFNNVIAGAGEGLAVKDSSEAEIVNNVLVQNKIGLNLYRNKAIFNGGEAKLINSIVWDNDTQIKKDDLSKIDVMSSAIEGGWSDPDTLVVTPLFNNAAAGDYTLARDKNPLLLKSGNVEAVRKYLDFPANQASIGLIAR